MFATPEIPVHSEGQLPVYNRFDALNPLHGSGISINTNPNTQVNTGVTNISRVDFERSSLDNKMVHLFDELRYIQHEQVNCSRGMLHFHQNLSAVNEKMGQVVQMSNAQLALMKTLAYKSIDQDARSRRNNLVFRGIAENFGENCLQLIYDFLRNRPNIAGDVYIDRAHRIFTNNEKRHRQIRPIIV